jgi:hypothetical protein
MRQPTPHEELHRLLCDLFSADELKVFAGLGPNGTEIVNQVHWADLEKSSYEYIRVLGRHALVDHDLFERLAAARPTRRDEIMAVAHRRKADRASTPATPVRKLALPWLIVGLVAIVPAAFLTSRACEAPPVPSSGLIAPTLTEAQSATPESASRIVPIAPVDIPPPVDETGVKPGTPSTPPPEANNSACTPPSRKVILDRLRRSGEGSLRACWTEFQMQTRVSPANCTLRLRWGTGGIKLTASTGHQAETRCFTKEIGPTLAPLKRCGADIDISFSLAEIEP